MIHITDGQSDEILDVIPAEDYSYENHHKSLKDTLETFNFTTFADKRYSQYLTKRNRAIIPDEDGLYVELIIHEAFKGTSRTTEVYTTASYLELKKAKKIKPQTLQSQTTSSAANFALSDTEWQPGEIIYAGIRSITIDTRTNPYAFLKRIANEFDLELRFRVEIEHNRIIGRFVDLIERIGEWQGREVEFGSDLIGINRREKTGDIVTALYVLGPEREDGTRLEVLVEDEDALQRWGRNGKHLIDDYEPISIDQDITEARLRQLGETELKKRVNAIVEYETTIVDLENVPGLRNKKIRFGDTIKIKDTKFNPPLYLEARIHTMDRSPKDKSKKTVTLGDYIEYTEDEVKAIWKSLQKEVAKKVSLVQLQAYAEPKRIYSDTPPDPSEQTENVTWVNTSQVPYVENAYNFEEWVPMSPTTAGEVNAYTQLETDNIAKDASRLETGIIDVGAVPLRTSATGARIEWDGINGLVQYDANGIVTSWLDLEGNFSTENGYFSGVIEASDIVGGIIEGAEFISENELAKLTLGGNPWLEVSSKIDGYNTRVADGLISLATGSSGSATRLSLSPSSVILANSDLTIRAENDDTTGSRRNVKILGADIETHGNRPLRLKSGPFDHVFMEFYKESADQTKRSGYVGYASNNSTTLMVVNDIGNVEIRPELNVSRVNNRLYNNNPIIRAYSSGVVDVNASNGVLRLGYEGTTAVDIYAAQIRHEYANDLYLRPYPGYDIRVADKNGVWRNVRGASFIDSSSIRFKKNIEDYTENALEKILNTKIVKYHYKDDLDEEFKHVGVIMEDSPVDIVDIRGEGVSAVPMASLAWKAIQEQYELYLNHDQCIVKLYSLHDKHDQRITRLEERVNKLEGVA